MSVVSAVVILRMLARGREVPASARLSYDSGNPYEVRFAFHAGLDDPVEWVFARCLLVDGLKDPAGAGDVRVWPSADGRIVVIGLSSPSGAARFEAPASSIARFLAETFRLVPDGTEATHCDIDAGIARILAEGGPQ
jgi:hypothetical protein